MTNMFPINLFSQSETTARLVKRFYSGSVGFKRERELSTVFQILALVSPPTVIRSHLLVAPTEYQPVDKVFFFVS